MHIQQTSDPNSHVILENGVSRTATSTEEKLIRIIKNSYSIGYDSGFNDSIIDIGLDVESASELFMHQIYNGLDLS